MFGLSGKQLTYIVAFLVVLTTILLLLLFVFSDSGDGNIDTAINVDDGEVIDGVVEEEENPSFIRGLINNLTGDNLEEATPDGDTEIENSGLVLPLDDGTGGVVPSAPTPVSQPQSFGDSFVERRTFEITTNRSSASSIPELPPPPTFDIGISNVTTTTPINNTVRETNREVTENKKEESSSKSVASSKPSGSNSIDWSDVLIDAAAFTTACLVSGFDFKPNLTEVTVGNTKKCALDTAVVELSKTIFLSLSQQYISWAEGGFQGKPLFVDDPKRFWERIANEETGRILDEGGFGFLCSADSIIDIGAQIELAQVNIETPPPRCTLDDYTANVRNLIHNPISVDLDTVYTDTYSFTTHDPSYYPLSNRAPIAAGATVNIDKIIERDAEVADKVNAYTRIGDAFIATANVQADIGTITQRESVESPTDKSVIAPRNCVKLPDGGEHCEQTESAANIEKDTYYLSRGNVRRLENADDFKDILGGILSASIDGLLRKAKGEFNDTSDILDDSINERERAQRTRYFPETIRGQVPELKRLTQTSEDAKNLVNYFQNANNFKFVVNNEEVDIPLDEKARILNNAGISSSLIPRTQRWYRGEIQKQLDLIDKILEETYAVYSDFAVEENPKRNQNISLKEFQNTNASSNSDFLPYAPLYISSETHRKMTTDDAFKMFVGKGGSKGYVCNNFYGLEYRYVDKNNKTYFRVRCNLISINELATEIRENAKQDETIGDVSVLMKEIINQIATNEHSWEDGEGTKFDGYLVPRLPSITSTYINRADGDAYNALSLILFGSESTQQYDFNDEIDSRNRKGIGDSLKRVYETSFEEKLERRI